MKYKPKLFCVRFGSFRRAAVLIYAAIRILSVHLAVCLSVCHERVPNSKTKKAHTVRKKTQKNDVNVPRCRSNQCAKFLVEKVQKDQGQRYG